MTEPTVIVTANKADIVTQSLYKASLQGAQFGNDPLTSTRALALLEMTMPALENEGILLGYKKDAYPVDADMDAESGLPDWSIDAVTSLLATKVYASVMNTTRPDLAAMASAAIKSLYPIELIQRENNTVMPVGAGNKHYAYAPQYQAAEEPITVTSDGNLGDLTI